MYITRQPDGTVLVETTAKAFLDEWKQASSHCKVLLDDKRPAIVRQPDMANGDPTFLTLMPAVWDRMKAVGWKKLQTARHPPHARLCEVCGAKLRLVCESAQHWIFKCLQCPTRETWGKTMLGGTIGAGNKEIT